MRRWLSILLILLPLQFSWGAVLPYGHPDLMNGGASEQHGAYDEHGAVPGQKHDAQHARNIAACDCLGEEHVCNYCDGPAAGPVVLLATQFATLNGSYPTVLFTAALPSRGPDRHERPKWKLA